MKVNANNLGRQNINVMIAKIKVVSSMNFSKFVHTFHGGLSFGSSQ